MGAKSYTRRVFWWCRSILKEVMEVTIWGLNLVVRKGSVLVVPKPLEGRIEVIFRDLNLRQAGRFLVVSEHLEIRIEVIFER